MFTGSLYLDGYRIIKEGFMDRKHFVLEKARELLGTRNSKKRFRL